MKLLAKVGTLALVAAAAMGAVAGCSSSLDTKQSAGKTVEGPTGTVGLTLQPVAGITVSTVHYIVKQGATIVSQGDLPTPGTASTFSFGLPLPVGTGYTISLSGVADQSAATTCVGSFGPFDVTANTSNQLTLKLVLTCTDANTGSINAGVSIETAGCPHLIVDYVVATPNSATAPGGKIAVLGSAHDTDGKPVTYLWTIADTTVGAFAPANANNSSFTCAGQGVNTVVTLTANNGECSKALTTFVSCASLTCGNGVLDTGEDCDASIPGSGPCPANCHRQCGNGVLEVPEQCDPVPADLNNCTATCTIRPKVCGDGFLETGEACDPSVTGTTGCNPDCTVNKPQVCKDGTVEPPEVCDVPFTVNNCGNNCLSITKASCTACEDLVAPGSTAPNCPGTSCDTVPGNAVSGPASGLPRAQLCNEVLDCVRTSGCAAGGKLPINCYCGAATQAQCSAGGGTGVCKAALERGLEATDFPTITSRLGATAFGGGKAMDRINCDQTLCDNTANSLPSGAGNPSECF